MCLPPSLTGCVRSGHRTGFCGAPWSRTSTPSRFRLSMCLSRRWRISWWKCFKRSTLGPRTRLSKCPRSFLTEFHSALWSVVLCRWRNSRWKCPRSVVEVNGEVFKVYTVDRVQQRFWSRSPSPQIQVEIFKIFSQSRVPQRLLRFLLDTLVNVFFRTFPVLKKSPTSTASPSALVHAHSSSSTHNGAVPRGDLWVQIMTDDDPCFWHRQEQTFCRRCRARSDLYHGAGKVWTVHELACFLSPFDVVVSVNMRDKFQQSLPICGWCLFSVLRQSGGYCRNATGTGTHIVKLCILDWLLTCPLLCLIWCSTSRCAGPAVSSGAVCEKTVEIPQLQHVEKFAAWTLLLHARCVQRPMPGGSECRKLRRSRSCRTFLPVVDVRVMQVVVVPQVQFCGYGRCCDHAVTSVSRTVKVPQTHRRSWWTLSVRNRDGHAFSWVWRR